MTRLSIADLEIERPGEGLEVEMADGTVYVLQDPKGMQIGNALNLESLPPLEQVKVLVAEDKWDEFASRPEVDGYFFEAVMKKYVAHYGLGDPGEGVASLHSLDRTARRSKPTSKRTSA